jgi:GT2 family glycosyltransferase
MITGIIVSYNQKHLLQQCVESIRAFYPLMKLVIIDGSNRGTECHKYAHSLQNKNTTVKCVEYNIGHGNGMKLGIGLSKTKYIALIDSDTIVKANIFEHMLNHFDDNVFGVGCVVAVDSTGQNLQNGIPYLHPYFCLINKNAYLSHDKIIHHGAPMLKTMMSIQEKRTHRLVNFNLQNFVVHLERGTRVLKPKEFNQKSWVKI